MTDPSLPRSLPTAGNVSVQWTDPAQFTEFRTSLNKQESADGDWVRQLATYLQKRAQKRLQPGQSLDVTITDIQRAGNYEPWHGLAARDIRVMRDIYIPRIAFDYTLRGLVKGTWSTWAQLTSDQLRAVPMEQTKITVK